MSLDYQSEMPVLLLVETGLMVKTDSSRINDEGVAHPHKKDYDVIPVKNKENWIEVD